MKVSYRWLSEYVDVSGYTARELAELLTRSGIEVDIVEERNQGVSGVVVGYVAERGKHPDADKLSVCKVDVGADEPLQIVCGAANVAAGQKVPVAVVGAVLPGDFKIKKAKLRGVESQGMICSAKELGLNDKLLAKSAQEGILVLPDELELGGDVAETLGLNDQVLELDLTPNRSDCLSMLGAAYEIAAITGRAVTLPHADVSRFEAEGPAASAQWTVELTDASLCSRYSAKVIEDVRIAPAPQWMQNRLMAAGVRPINNIVDITNYVMLEYGQPLHAFDAALLAGGRIVVRPAAPGETLVTLDGNERKLEPHMLVIADADKPIALAGVMGGADSEVSGATTRIVLESANFAGSSVRKTSRQLGLRSEASLRFEKEANPDMVVPALERAAALIAEYAGGRIAPGIAESVASVKPEAALQLGVERVNRYLGTALTLEQIGAIFDRLQFSWSGQEDALLVTVPNRRGDITRDVDLIEEVARLYGYDNIPTTLVTGATTPGKLTKPQLVRRQIRRLLTGAGLHEAISYSFTSPAKAAMFQTLNPGAAPIRLAMPMSEERSALRTSLTPLLLEAAAHNRSRNNYDIALFEIGQSYATREQRLSALPAEEHRLALLLAGKRAGEHWSGDAGAVDFYDLKGMIDKLAVYLGVQLEWRAGELDGLHPGRTAEIAIAGGSGQTIGWAGQLHPAEEDKWDVAETYVAELDLSVLYEHASFEVDYRPLPKYPAISRDIAVIVDKGTAAGDLTAHVRETAGQWLESVYVFDVYEGERLGEGKKSIALALSYRDAERTLTDEEVSEAHERVVAALAERFGAELRK